MRRGIRLKHIKVMRPRLGAVYRYYAKPGYKMMRLPDLPENHPDFIAAYARAAAGAAKLPSAKRPTDGSVAALCTAYRASAAFLSLRPSTREMRLRIIDKIAQRGETAMVADLLPRHIRNDIADLTPDAANNRLKVWRSLTKFAIEDLEWIETDPARDVAKIKVNRVGHHCWTDEEIAQYRAFHPKGTKARRAFELALWTGARRGDLVRLGHQNISGDGKSLTYKAEKTNVTVCIPVWPEIATELKNAPRLLFLETAHGKPHSVKAFGAWFKARCRAADLPDRCTLHGLRKARARIMAEEGRSAPAIAAWGGWKTLAEVAHYTEAADRKRLTHETKRDQKLDTRSKPVSENSEKARKFKGGN